MNKHFYPAVFEKEDIGYSVSFPDLDGCFTQGDTLDEALTMATEALRLFLDDNGSFIYPNSSKPQNVAISQNQFLKMICFDETKYRKRTDTKAVKEQLNINA